jgi:hypothetical protein
MIYDIDQNSQVNTLVSSIPLYHGLRDADERDQTYDRQNLYQHGIPQPHNLLLWREKASSTIQTPFPALNRDPTTGNKLIDEYDCGDNQQ